MPAADRCGRALNSSTPGAARIATPLTAREGAAAPTNMKSTAALDDSNPAKAFYSDQEMVKRLQFMAPLTDDEKQKYSDLWTEVKTAYAG